MASDAPSMPPDTLDVPGIVAAFEKEEREKPKSTMTGGVGTVRKISMPDGEFYFVKKIVYPSISAHKDKEVTNEIELNEFLAKDLPDVVSRMLASVVQTEGDTKTAYLIFEGLTGVDGLDYMRRLPSDEEIARITECVRSKLTQLHAKKYYHLDLQPPNVFIITDGAGKFMDCRLIDFGNSQYMGEDAFTYDDEEDPEEKWGEWVKRERRHERKNTQFMSDFERALKDIRDGFAKSAAGPKKGGSMRRKATRRQAQRQKGKQRLRYTRHRARRLTK